jgi:hypothetical protein
VDEVPVVEEAPAPVSEEPVTDGGTTDASVAEPQVSSEAASEDASSAESTSGDLPSDGTDGPAPPVTGSDGTGGARDLALPRIP